MFATFSAVLYALGFLTALKAILETRSPQGAIAWALFLVTFPYLALPAFWIFGRSRFDGYRFLRRRERLERNPAAQQALERLRTEGLLHSPEGGERGEHARTLERLARLPFTRGNRVELLIDGEATFAAILSAIERAERYVLVEFYLLRHDRLGERLADSLEAACRRGVAVHLIYDSLGSLGLARAYLERLERAGVRVAAFDPTRGLGNWLRFDFRNHRKIVVVDGLSAFVGGHNVGDEYLGLDPHLGHWRDTHVGLWGPVVQEVQVPFAEDWEWATGEPLELDWEPRRAEGADAAALCLATGPADDRETATLGFLSLIQAARRRLWIVNPYFVPDTKLMAAMELAVLRGVEVRVLVPKRSDNRLVDLAKLSYLEDCETAGIQVLRYGRGILHQKVLLVDDDLAAVGTHNFDNRSMRLNFELSIVVEDSDFAARVETMLRADFEGAEPASGREYSGRALPVRLAIRLARLFAPVL